MAPPKAAIGPPVMLKERLALNSAKTVFCFPQTETEISIPACEINIEAKLMEFLQKQISSSLTLSSIAQKGPATWQIKRPDGLQIQLSKWDVEAKVQLCFIATLNPAPKPLLVSTGFDEPFAVPDTHIYLDLHWVEQGPGKKKKKSVVEKQISLLAPKHCTISNLVRSLEAILSVARVASASADANGLPYWQVYLSSDTKPILELVRGKFLELALDVGTGTFLGTWLDSFALNNVL